MIRLTTLLLLLSLCTACASEEGHQASADKKAILQTLSLETEYFCTHDAERWADQWIQQPYAYKMYTGDTPFREFGGWEAIRKNTLAHIEEHPGLIPVPTGNPDYEVQLFGETAFVSYSSAGNSQPKDEFRVMVKEGGKWKIARMVTTYR